MRRAQREQERAEREAQDAAETNRLRAALGPNYPFPVACVNRGEYLGEYLITTGISGRGFEIEQEFAEAGNDEIDLSSECTIFVQVPPEHARDVLTNIVPLWLASQKTQYDLKYSERRGPFTTAGSVRWHDEGGEFRRYIRCIAYGSEYHWTYESERCFSPQGVVVRRRLDAATLLESSPIDIEEISAAEVREALAGLVPEKVLEVATQTTPDVTFWAGANHRFDKRENAARWFVFDDPHFGEVVRFSDLRYDSEIGLHVS